MRKLLFLLYLLFLFVNAISQDKTDLRYDDKIRIREAIKLSERIGNTIWDKSAQVPFVVLLIIDSIEFLINHPNPSKEFTLLGEDDVLKTNIYYRKKVFNPHYLATFPAVNGVPTIVVGTPENTGKSSTEWIITLLHEHFHQYQMTYPKYYENVKTLDLSGGDQSGMWMLNYPFPYDSIPVMNQFNKLTMALSDALRTNTQFNSKWKKYVLERKKFKELLKPADYRYFAFQLWQEGIARYSEYKFLKLLQGVPMSKEIKMLKDYISIKDLTTKLYKNEISNIATMKLNDIKRIAFYSLGFGEGLLVDKVNKDWRKKYVEDVFFMEKYLE